MATPFIASRVYLKPLLPEQRFKGNIDVILRKVKRDLLRRIRSKLTQTTFSKRAKVALSKALSIELKPSSLVITAKHPAFAPLVLGQRKGQMKWLMKARKPIPIITEEGKLIFRNATARSMKNGPMTGPNVGRKKGWVHPGRPPSDFLDQAKSESRTFLKKKFQKELRAQIRSAWSR